MKRIFALAVASVLFMPASSEVNLINSHKPVGRIILTDTLTSSREAGNLLRLWGKRITGAELPVLTDTAPRKNDIVISSSGGNNIKEDGFALTTDRNILHIKGADKGAIYGVITLLERYAGCNYWSEHEYTAPASASLSFPDINIAENPAFRYRQSQNYALATDPEYRKWMRLEEPADEFASSLWVHTFDRLLPSAIYGKEHPEYYAYFNGKRHPGKASQWCLTNPEVLETVSHRIDSIFKANPDKNMISVSQNDGNRTNCTCLQCAEIDSIEGGPSGSLIYFLNKLAERMPDKQFSTLAYLYTMHPPKHIKPRENVNIMLCDIDCYREVPLTDNVTGRDFMKALTGWAQKSNNIFVWDYGINFDGYLTPFPNFHILAPNIRTFRDNNVSMHFSQIASSRGGDFAEMRTWIVSKLMWNPDADADSLMNTFLNGYYGKAAPMLKEYHSSMLKALKDSGQGLWIYDSPVTHKHGMLNADIMKHYNNLFNAAEQAVASDSILLARVQRSRLPLIYSELEIMRTEPDKDTARIIELLDKLEYFSTKFNVKAINERTNSPHEYAELYRSRYMPASTSNIASHAKVTIEPALVAPYNILGAESLTDGVYGGATFKDSWIGWEGQDATITADLGTEKEFTSISADFLHQLGQWILLPKSVTFSVSNDGIDYSSLARHDIPEDSDPKVKFLTVSHTSTTPVKARYIKIEVEGTKECPHWHYGVGNKCWFFMDEITVH